MVGILTIIAAILIGVVLMFQPITPKPFNLGFDFVLIALLAFNIWSHVNPKPRRAQIEAEDDMEKYGYRFSFGPWNIHSGADPFGPRSAPDLPSSGS